MSSNSSTPEPHSGTPQRTATSRRVTYFRLLSFLKPYRGRFLLAIVATAFYAAAEASLASLMQPLLDGTFINKDPFYIRWIPILIAGVFIFRSIMSFASEMGMQSVSTKVIRDIRQQLYARTLQLSDNQLSQAASGEVQSLFVYNAQEMLNATTNVLTTLIRDSLVIIGLVGFIFYQHWQLACILLIIVPVIVLVTRLVNIRLKRLSATLMTATGSIGQRVNETIAGHRELKIYDAGNMAEDRFADANETVRRTTIGVTRARVIASQLSMLVTVVAMSAMIYAAIYYANHGALTVGKFISIFTAMAMLLAPIKRLTTVNELLQRGITAAERVFEWLDLPGELDDAPTLNVHSKDQRPTALPPQADIHFRNISVQYPGKSERALDTLSLTIPFGKTTALVGQSGGGKTTLLHLLPRLVDPSDGVIYLGEQPFSTIQRAELRKAMSYVGQFPVLFDLSVIENIRFTLGIPDDAATLQRVERALDDANALDFVTQLPDGLHTAIGPNGSTLSGGQCQRLALARALYHESPYMLLDEVTSALDAESEQKIQTALAKLHGRKTIIIIAHRLSTIRNADQIVMMSDGKIVEIGDHQTLMAREGDYHALIKQQLDE